MQTLYFGDCLKIMPTLDEQSVDAIITDLPYGTTACDYDVIIPFKPMWEQVRRILKPRGAFITTSSQPFTSVLVTSNIEWFKYEWIWEKEQGSNLFNAPYQPLKSHENILVFSPDASSYSPNGSMKYNPQYTSGKPYKSNTIPGEYKFHSPKNYETTNDGKRHPKTVLRINKETGHHPAQKPVSLYEYLVRTYTDIGDTILDIAMGSGTTGVACANTGRNFIGIELDATYFSIAKSRITSASQQTHLFF